MLDIGCGEGHLLKIATEDGWQITGTEISVKATETANQLLENKVLAGDILDLNLPDNSFDLITIYHVIEHLIEPIPTLEKIKQLLKPNGIAFIETPNIGSLGARIKGKKWSHIIPPEHISYFDRHSLKQALKTAEFSQYHVFTTAPQTINSIANWVEPIKSTATAIYNLAPILGLGAELQAVAFKEVI
jgi:2-polyprenyl-3-methyl-5-hydroxy-6-metoxy-1,4-benzoquinol methylase